MRVIIDPNVIVSALLSPGSTPDRVVQAALGGSITAVVSPRLLDEVREVTRRPKFERLDRADVERVLDGLAAVGTLPDPDDVPTVTRDPDDDYLVALARAAGVDTIVSGDRDLLDADLTDIAVLTPRTIVNERLLGA